MASPTPMRSLIADVEKIRELQSGLSMTDFALKIGIARQIIYRIYGGERCDWVTLLAIKNAFRNEVSRVDDLILPEPASNHLADRITRAGLWPDIVQAAANVAIMAGTTSMRRYSESGEGNSSVAGDTSLNPTFLADLESEVAAVRTAYSLLAGLASALCCGISLSAEELLKRREAVVPFLGDAARAVHDRETFFSVRENAIRVLCDPLDGSNNHAAGIPLFCAAVAILIEEEVRVAAIMDIPRNTVYTAALMGPYGTPEKSVMANAWSLNTGHTTDLVGRSRKIKKEAKLKDGDVASSMAFLRSRGAALHLPRSKSAEPGEPASETVKRQKRDGLLGRMGALSEQFRSLYLLNAGIPAMTLVARSSMAAFVNPWTHLHDIAAPEVLCRATGHSVTTWEGTPISYNDLARDANGDFVTLTSAAVSRREVHRHLLTMLQP